MRDDTQELIDKFQNGELDVTDARLVDNAGQEAIETSPEVMVSYSLRLPIPVFEQLQQLASDKGTKWSTLVRDWVTEKVNEATTTADPYTEIEASITRLQHAAAQLKQAA